MLRHLVARRLVSRRRPRSDRDNRRQACGLTVEALEDRLLLSGDMVIRWNAALLAAVRTAGISPVAASRTMAIVETAVYEAVNSIDQSYTHYLVDIPAPPWANEDAAAAKAAHDALVGLFPAQASVLDLEMKASLQGIADGDAKTWGIQVGRAAAQIMLAVRAHDGSDKVVNYTPGTNPGDWQPTPPAYLPAREPQWRYVTPFCLQSASQFRPDPPPALTSPEYTAAFKQVKELGSFDSKTRTADQTEAALFWDGIIPGATPHGSGDWGTIAQEVAVAQGNTLVQNARLFALLSLAMADEAIAFYDAKYTYSLWRPVTAIRAADTDGNPDTEADPSWTPLKATPNHASYPSAHATFSTGSATVLASFFGTDAIPFSLSTDGFPGVTRSFDSFSAAAHEAGLSRIWIGYHWSFDITAGDALGRSVGAYTFQNFLLPRTSPAGSGSAAMISFVKPGASTGGETGSSPSGGTSLPAGQPTVYPVPVDTTSNTVVSDTRAVETSFARSDGGAQTHGGGVDEIFGSMDFVL